MNPRKVTDNVFFVGAPDWIGASFDALIRCRKAQVYNAYLITGQEKLPSSILWIHKVGRFESLFGTNKNHRLRYHPARGTGPQRIIAHGA